MTSIEERYAVERAKWDAHAGDPTKPLRALGPGKDFRSLADAPLMPGMVAFLGDLRGKRVIEYGCGLGKMTVLLARSGAHVTAFDLSERSLEVARQRAILDGVPDSVDFHLAPGESLPFEDASFDVAFGMAVLHHIEPVAGARELARVLRPGGRAAFSEPLGTNPIVRLARDHVPYPHKHDRGADIPLRYEDVAAWLAPFERGDIRGVQITSMVERMFGFKTAIEPLRYIDRELLRRWPGLWPLCRYGVLTMVR